MSTKLFITMLATTLFVIGCAQQQKVPPDDMPESMDTANTMPDTQPVVESPTQMADDSWRNLVNTKTVYFEFDRSDIRSDYAAVVEAHGKYLAENSSRKVRLEGHADERGSREYNVGLGERRAQSVRRVLLLHGASASQITTLSYGEERPAVDAHNESAWSQNRRVVFAY